MSLTSTSGGVAGPSDRQRSSVSHVRRGAGPSATKRPTKPSSWRISSTAPTQSSPAISTDGCASLRIRTHSLCASRQLTGTTTTPALAAAKYRTAYHGAFLSTTARRLPLPHPARDKPARQPIRPSRPPRRNSACGRRRSRTRIPVARAPNSRGSREAGSCISRICSRARCSRESRCVRRIPGGGSWVAVVRATRPMDVRAATGAARPRARRGDRDERLGHLAEVGLHRRLGAVAVAGRDRLDERRVLGQRRPTSGPGASTVRNWKRTIWECSARADVARDAMPGDVEDPAVQRRRCARTSRAARRRRAAAPCRRPARAARAPRRRCAAARRIPPRPTRAPRAPRGSRPPPRVLTRRTRAPRLRSRTTSPSCSRRSSAARIAPRFSPSRSASSSSSQPLAR